MRTNLSPWALIPVFFFTLGTRSPRVFAKPIEFQAQSGPIPKAVAKHMQGSSLHPGCPVSPPKLRYLRLRHHGYDGQIHEGELIVHQDLAGEVIELFRALFAHRFPVAKMRLVDAYQGDDNASMADNNTSAFNCRVVTGRPGIFSQHAYGRAIDINPLVNPYVMETQVLPPEGAKYKDRSATGIGVLRPGNPMVEIFLKAGWTWGGNFKRVKDYQHFEK